MTEEEVTLQAIQQFVSTHASRELIESIAEKIRAHAHDKAGRIAVALVFAELAARPSSGETQ